MTKYCPICFIYVYRKGSNPPADETVEGSERARALGKFLCCGEKGEYLFWVIDEGGRYREIHHPSGVRVDPRERAYWWHRDGSVRRVESVVRRGGEKRPNYLLVHPIPDIFVYREDSNPPADETVEGVERLGALGKFLRRREQRKYRFWMIDERTGKPREIHYPSEANVNPREVDYWWRRDGSVRRLSHES